jgi:hypothetical protein
LAKWGRGEVCRNHPGDIRDIPPEASAEGNRGPAGPRQWRATGEAPGSPERAHPSFATMTWQRRQRCIGGSACSDVTSIGITSS